MDLLSALIIAKLPCQHYEDECMKRWEKKLCLSGRIDNASKSYSINTGTKCTELKVKKKKKKCY